MNKVAKQSEDLYKEKIEQLKKIYPALFDDEGNLNEEELKRFLKQFASTSEGKYEFNWAGKMSAKRNAFTTSRAMLKPDKERSVDFDNTENLIIEGDNLEVLKLLQKSYQGKIKCIYIDPPYNTGNDFIYTDNFSEDKKAYWEKSGTTQDGVKLDTNTESQGRYHSNWLNMIYPRLTIARNLLKDDGVIFVSIDDNEVHNLRKVMDEVYGEENFIGIFVVNSTPNARDYGHIAKMHDYCIMYAKNIIETTTNLIPENNKHFTYVDDKGSFNIHPLYNSNEAFTPQNRPNLYYPFYLNPIKDTESNFYKISLSPKEGWIEIFPSKSVKNNVQFVWRWGKELASKNINTEIVGYRTKEGEYRVVEKMRHNAKRIRSLIDGKVFTSRRGTAELETIFKGKYFSFPKSTGLLKLLFTSSLLEDDIILDFFAGSGTTAQAVMELNKEDSGNRKFILVQIPEKTDESSEAYKAGYKKISNICIERVKRVSNKLKEEKTEGDLGFKVFTLSPSYFPENLFTPDPEKTEEENKKALAKYIEEASTQLEFKFDEFDLMYEVLLKDGFTLNFKAEKLSEFTKNNIYKVTDGEKHAYVTLDSDLKDETLQKLQSYTGERFICLERAVDTTKKWNLQNMFGSNLWVI